MTTPRIKQTHGQAMAIEASAGLALGCHYSSSHEFEAELIRARLAADGEKYRVRLLRVRCCRGRDHRARLSRSLIPHSLAG
jgi:hypothetical protein